MRLKGLFPVGVLVVSAYVLPAAAQVSAKSALARESLAQAPQPTVGTNLLDLDDGLAVLGAALESRHKANPRSDCSHLVQIIYEKAGFPYPYQTSRDLFAGHSPDFRRVTQPQPGDLIVWAGHAGVVVNPAQRTFYSSLRSGFGVQPYDSAYWKGRGRPRFFRYVKSSMQPPPPPLQAAANRTPTLKPVDFHPDADTTRPLSPGFGANVPVDGNAAALPTAVMVTINSARPQADQIQAALDQQFKVSDEKVQSRNILALYPSLIAFDRMDIKKVQLKENQGWVQVAIRGAVMVAGADKRPRKKLEMQRWQLLRTGDDSWEIVLPSDTTYIPRETAVHILAQQLAALTDSASDSAAQGNQKVQLAHWLNVLLDSH
jgi:NlpC/P60 family protein